MPHNPRLPRRETWVIGGTLRFGHGSDVERWKRLVSEPQAIRPLFLPALCPELAPRQVRVWLDDHVARTRGRSSTWLVASVQGTQHRLLARNHDPLTTSDALGCLLQAARVGASGRLLVARVDQLPAAGLVYALGGGSVTRAAVADLAGRWLLDPDVFRPEPVPEPLPVRFRAKPSAGPPQPPRVPFPEDDYAWLDGLPLERERVECALPDGAAYPFPFLGARPREWECGGFAYRLRFRRAPSAKQRAQVEAALARGWADPALRVGELAWEGAVLCAHLTMCAGDEEDDADDFFAAVEDGLRQLAGRKKPRLAEVTLEDWEGAGCEDCTWTQWSLSHGAG